MAAYLPPVLSPVNGMVIAKKMLNASTSIMSTSIMLMKPWLSSSLLNIAAIFLASNALGVDVAPAEISSTSSMIPSDDFLILVLGVKSNFCGEHSSETEDSSSEDFSAVELEGDGKSFLTELCPS